MNGNYLQKVIDACPVEFYLSANDNCMVHWPFRMQPVHEAASRYQEDSQKYIVDSSFSDEDITNEDTLHIANELNADIAVLEDVYQNYSKTVERLLEGFELYDSHLFNGDVVAPLQAPHVDCWEEVGEPDMIAIGGVKDKPASEKVRIAQQVRDSVGSDVWIHGLGFGATPEVVQAVRNNPELLDSIDAQTPYANVNDTRPWPGEHRTATVALRSKANLVEKCRRMSPSLTKDPDPKQMKLP